MVITLSVRGTYTEFWGALLQPCCNEVFGDGEPTVLLMPTHPIVHSLMWKGQVAYLARHFRVVTFDPRGNGKSDRPTEPSAYDDSHYVSDAVQVLDKTATERAVLVGLCGGAGWSLQLGAAHPDRVLGVVSIATGLPFLAPPHPHRIEYSFDEELGTDAGWAKNNRHFWKRDCRAFVEFFFEELLPEPHSTKQWEDCIACDTRWRRTPASGASSREDQFPHTRFRSVDRPSRTSSG